MTVNVSVVSIVFGNGGFKEAFACNVLFLEHEMTNNIRLPNNIFFILLQTYY